MKMSFTKVLTMVMMMASTLFVTSCEKIDDWLFGDGDEEVVRVNPEYVPIDWDNAALLSSNDSTGDYQIQFEGTVPDIHPGSVLAIDQDTVVHYIFVESVSVNGNTMNITSSEAYLTDIFYDSEFTLSTAAKGKSSAKGVVFYPVEAYMIDENGEYQVLDMFGRKDDTRITHNLWHYGFNNDGYVIHSGVAHSILMDKMNMDVDVDLEMLVNFSGRDKHEVVADCIDRYKSRTLKVKAELVGKFNTEQQIRSRVWGSCHISPPSITLFSNIFPSIPLKFMAGTVPIVLKLQSDLCCQLEVNASGEIQAYTGFSDNAEGRVGFEWSQMGGMSPLSSFKNTYTFTPPTIEGRGEIQNKVSLFPHISVMLYGVIGPSFDIMPYSSETERGGYREQLLGQTNDYCAWSYDYNVGLDLRCGLSLSFFDNSLLDDMLPSPSLEPWNVVDKNIYHSPKKVVHVSGRPSLGQTQTVRFDVYDTNLLTHRAVKTLLPQIVKFEANGRLSSEYGMASYGTVSVNWTPTMHDILYAKLYDIDGNVLAWDSIHAPGPSDDWVDLGLPSGLLWATRNVGASSPEDYGDYFAWGETTPKNVYDWSTYRYCNGDYDELTKYCNNSSYGYNGFTDNLTILQPGDDAATANYGGRTPTKEEWQELMNNTTVIWTTQNGVNGRRFTGSNGNSLFLPAAGYRWDSSLYGAGSDGSYWSSSLYTYYPIGAWLFSFDSDGQGVNIYGDRFFGFTVRAVR